MTQDETQSEFKKVARSSKRTILIVQILMAVILSIAMLSIIVMGIVIFQDHSQIRAQQQVILGQQASIAFNQHRIGILAFANALESRRVKNALCDEQFTIATAPLNGPTTKIGVQFVEASRKAFVLLGCPGIIGPVPKELVVLGRQFGIAIRY